MNRRTLLTGTAALAALAALPARATAAGWARPPAPLANVTIAPATGRRLYVGPADADLLLVAPAGTYGTPTQVIVRGYRGIWLVGGAYDRAPTGWLTAPNGVNVVGTGSILDLQNHAEAVDPFVYLADLAVDTRRICFGDLLKVGCRGRPTRLWMERVRVSPGCVGWGGWFGGSYGHYVSHSDLRKADNGDWSDVWTSDCDLGWGFQCAFDVPSFAVNYGGSGGVSHFRRTTFRPIVRHPNFPQAGDHDAKALVMRIGGEDRRWKTFDLEDGCALIPPVGHDPRQFIQPATAGRTQADGSLLFNQTWARGRLGTVDRRAASAPVSAHRVATRAALVDYWRTL